MIPQVRAVIRKFLEPLRAVKPAGTAIDPNGSSKNESGGYGSPGYERPEPPAAEVVPIVSETYSAPSPLPPEDLGLKNSHLLLEIKRGLTDVVVALHTKPIERREKANPESATDSYVTNALIRKGAVVDKKVG